MTSHSPLNGTGAHNTRLQGPRDSPFLHNDINHIMRPFNEDRMMMATFVCFSSPPKKACFPETRRGARERRRDRATPIIALPPHNENAQVECADFEGRLERGVHWRSTIGSEEAERGGSEKKPSPQCVPIRFQPNIARSPLRDATGRPPAR